jgi:hypothetical protein
MSLEEKLSEVEERVLKEEERYKFLISLSKVIVKLSSSEEVQDLRLQADVSRKKVEEALNHLTKHQKTLIIQLIKLKEGTYQKAKVIANTPSKELGDLALKVGDVVYVYTVTDGIALGTKGLIWRLYRLYCNISLTLTGENVHTGRKGRFPYANVQDINAQLKSPVKKEPSQEMIDTAKNALGQVEKSEKYPFEIANGCSYIEIILEITISFVAHNDRCGLQKKW